MFKFFPCGYAYAMSILTKTAWSEEQVRSFFMFVLIFLSLMKTSLKSSKFLHGTMYTWRILEETWQAIKQLENIKRFA